MLVVISKCVVYQLEENKIDVAVLLGSEILIYTEN